MTKVCAVPRDEDLKGQRRIRSHKFRLIWLIYFFLFLLAAVAPSSRKGTSDLCPARVSSDALTSVGSIETCDEEGNHVSKCTTGNDEEGKEDRVSPDLSAEPVTEFSCGLEAAEEEEGGTSLVACTGGGGGGEGYELYQYEGVPEEEGAGQNGLDFPLKPRVPALTVIDRLTELHGSEALSFSSALAAQVAARSHSLINMEEQTFGDDEGSGRGTPEED